MIPGFNNLYKSIEIRRAIHYGPSAVYGVTSNRRNVQDEPRYVGVRNITMTALGAPNKGRNPEETRSEIGEFEGLQGPSGFDDFGDSGRPNASISTVGSQQFTALE
jgi:hypothetical protein